MHTNFVILRSDEHNPRISALEGHPFIQTPNLERLAEQGTVYGSHYCPSPLCMPSRSSFLAGRWAHQIQTYNNCGIVPVDTESYGGVLDRQGIHSVMVGKVDGFRTRRRDGVLRDARSGVSCAGRPELWPEAVDGPSDYLQDWQGASGWVGCEGERGRRRRQEGGAGNQVDPETRQQDGQAVDTGDQHQ